MAKKILLADDSPTIRKVVELTFADEGIEVYSVPDGDAAMVTFVRIEPDMVIADVHMPGMNGYRLCEMIKQDETTSHIPVILLVGSFETFDPGEASRVGCDHYFTKPFRSIRELVAKVNECFSPGYGTVSARHDTADIEDLYKSSLEPDAETRHSEDDVLALTADSRTAEDTLSESDASPDQFVAESAPAAAAAEPDLRVSESSAVHDGPATSTFDESEEISDEDEILDRLGSMSRPQPGSLNEAPRSQAVAEDPWDDDVLGLGIGQPKQASENTRVENIDPGEQPTSVADDAALHLTDVPPEKVRTTGDLGPSPWEQPVTDTAQETFQLDQLAASSPADVLGDSGMDDEIIETSHPEGELPYVNPETTPASFPQNAAAIDPFTERVGVFNDPDPALEQRSTPIEEPAPADDREVTEVEQPATSATVTESEQPKLAGHVTPELIESIVASVLEKMSDRAVRQAAQEAVPRIAEKLIREALTDDEKNARADAAKE